MRGTKFIKDKKYVTLDNRYVPAVLRKKVQILRKEFDIKNPKKYLCIRVDLKDFGFNKDLETGDEF